MSDLLLDMPDVRHIATGELLVRVTSRQNVKTPFVAGLIYDTGKDRVVETAPILKHLLGSHADRVRELARQNGWTVTIVKIGE